MVVILSTVPGLRKIFYFCYFIHDRVFDPCGVNPGLHEFADQILARADVPKMPTCTAVLLALPHEYWGLADWHEAQLIGYITPKSLERRFPELYGNISQGDGDD